MNEEKPSLEKEYAEVFENAERHPIDARIIKLEQEVFRLNQKTANLQPSSPSREVIGAPAISANSTTLR